MINKLKFNCLTCGKEVYRWPSEIKNPEKIFCSPSCKAKQVRSGWDEICPVCGATFHTSPWYKKNGYGNHCSKKCASIDQIKFIKDQGGYVKVYRPGHHRATHHGYVFEHILVAEEAIGREIYLDEVVHHLDGDRKNNAPENLEVVSRAEHMKIHDVKPPWRSI